MLVRSLAKVYGFAYYNKEKPKMFSIVFSLGSGGGEAMRKSSPRTMKH